jgi:hypothetical protein
LIKSAEDDIWDLYRRWIKSNLAEASEELEEKIESGEMLDEVEYQIKIEHV